MITSVEQLVAFCKSAGVSVVALDIRGTLVDPNRSSTLARIAKKWGVPDDLASILDETVPRAVKTKYRLKTGVLDWSLVTGAELWAECMGHGFSIDACEFEEGINELLLSYSEEAVALVQDQQLEEILWTLVKAGIVVAIVCDGNYRHQQMVLNRLFPLSMKFVSHIFASGELGVNKLSPEFYEKVAAFLNILPHKLLIVGDRLDKDVKPARQAGCQTLLVVDQEGSDTIRPLATITEKRDRYRVGLGAIIGRFQPFHNDHLEYLTYALDRSERIIVGISNPFPSVLTEVGEPSRVLAENNPLPYWLRASVIRQVMNSLRVSENRFTILPVILSPKLLQSSLPPFVEIFTTGPGRWSDEKEHLLRSEGFNVTRLYERSKSITGTKIRALIRNREPWRHLVPDAVAAEYGNIIEEIIGL